ncbi:MAG: hypothetical protein EXS49_01330 [Candidatus Pacebacteria bacterium]|nr:hypothetical protein [Candidatus Paceibacterota bacterium]
MELQERVKKISLALIQIAVSSRRHDFRARLEKLALDLLEKVLLNRKEETIESINLAIGLVDFGKIIYEVEPLNALIIRKELSSLLEYISGKTISLFDIDNHQFSFDGFELKNKASTKKENRASINQGIESLGSIYNTAKEEPSAPYMINNQVVENTAIRQNAIIEKIRQMDKPAQLKDLIALFPDISERTLRYDLTRACAEGRLERVGSGPASFYRVRSI